MSPDLTAPSIHLDLQRTGIILIPAMTANTFAPFLGGGMPVDLGKARRDGRRYLGDGKTWRGFIGGSLCAAELGMLLLLGMHLTGFRDVHGSLWGGYPINMLLILSMAVGSLVGDMIGSFVKRAIGRPRGARTFLLDQWDYVLGAALFILPFYPWWFRNFIADLHWISLLLFVVVAYFAHVIANRIGYWIGVKKEPW